LNILLVLLMVFSFLPILGNGSYPRFPETTPLSRYQFRNPSAVHPPIKRFADTSRKQKTLAGIGTADEDVKLLVRNVAKG